MRKDRSFDDIIKDKLSNVSPPYQPDHWERLRERLDKEHQDEESDIVFFDRIVRQKTPTVTNTGFSSNWVGLVNRLDLIYRRERDLALSKVLEMLAFLLLFYIVDKHVSSQSGILLVDTQVRTETDGAGIKFHAHKSNEKVAPADLSLSKPIQDFVSLSTTSDQVPLDQTGQAQEAAFLFFHNDLQRYAHLHPVSSLELHLPEIVQADTRESVLEMPENPLQVFSKTSSKSKTGRFTLSMLGSTDINSIYTPGSIEGPFSELDRTTFVIPALHRFSPGYGGGASLGFQNGRMETEIGVLYTAKFYQARPVLYVTGSVSEGFSAEGLKDIEMNMVSVPFQLKYHWLDNNNWRFYTGLGANLNVIMESNIQLADEDAFRSSSFNLSLPDPNPSGGPKSRGLNSKNLEGGWLQGGGFSKNAYITGTLSAGLERKFESGWSVFFQPTYQHSLYYFSKGIGPDNDRIHTFSLISGIRIRM